ncbi:hypothetical protein NDU88_010898 [Pleurodeles waltl]|uniref:Uncharacterized protein n=1 Tax=Pleurodeles waltl TaxID=8319 RepID=A0AAV7QX99_PLEWA|nr:hypothetical protein NDU88_010898 [Pleurodeles waltl]
MCCAHRSRCRQWLCDCIGETGAVVLSGAVRCAVSLGHGAGIGIVVAEALSSVAQVGSEPREWVPCGVHGLRCRQAHLLTTLESMVLASVDRGCSVALDCASCSSQVVSTGHGAGSGVGVSRSGGVEDAQDAV